MPFFHSFASIPLQLAETVIVAACAYLNSPLVGGEEFERQARPVAANLSFSAGQVMHTALTASLGDNGKFSAHSPIRTRFIPSYSARVRREHIDARRVFQCHLVRFKLFGLRPALRVAARLKFQCHLVRFKLFGIPGEPQNPQEFIVSMPSGSIQAIRLSSGVFAEALNPVSMPSGSIQAIRLHPL